MGISALEFNCWSWGKRRNKFCMEILFLLQGNPTLYGLDFQLKARQIHLFILKTFLKKKIVSLLFPD